MLNRGDDMGYFKKNIPQMEKKKYKRQKKAVWISVILTAFLILSSITSFADEYTVDENLSMDYESIIGSEQSLANPGLIWGDKTVYKDNAVIDDGKGSIQIENDGDFLISYSAIGTAQSIKGKDNAPLDVIFVLDLSGSMREDMENGKTRIRNAVKAVNETMEALMELSDETRIGIVGFSTTAKVLLPLEHYEKYIDPNGKVSDFIDIKEKGQSTFGSKESEIFIKGVNSKEQLVINRSMVDGGTNTQVGISEGMRLLENAYPVTTEIEGKTFPKIPSVIMMTDGAAGYSSDSKDWWNPANNSGNGNGIRWYAGQGMKLMLTGEYKKKSIDRHYQIENTVNTMKVYTVGMGITDLSGRQKDLADISLNPTENWFDKNEIATEIREAWGKYKKGQNPDIEVNDSSVGRNNFYQITHPEKDKDIDTLHYVDKYYSANDAESIIDAFKDIINELSIEDAEVPTKLPKGANPFEDGYVTFTDPIGEYMEVKDVKAIVYDGKEYQKKSIKEEGSKIIYTFEGDIQSSLYGSTILEKVLIEVERIGQNYEVMKIKIPAGTLPLQVNQVTYDKDGQIIENIIEKATPIRVLYTVGLQKNINPETLEGVSSQYIESNLQDGKVRFYANFYSEKKEEKVTIGDAKTEFIPSVENKWYKTQKMEPVYKENPAITETAETAVYTKNDKDNKVVTFYGNNGLLLKDYQVEPYILSGKTNLAVQKILEGREWSNRDSFTFTLEAANDYTAKAIEAGDIILPNKTEITITKSSEGMGKFRTNHFDDIRFNKTGDYQFRITEVKGNIPNMEYDDHEMNISLSVIYKDLGLELAAPPTIIGSSSFTNVYCSDPTDLVKGFEVKKIVKSETENPYELKEGDFSFTLTPSPANPEEDPIKDPITVQNDIYGTAVFSDGVVYTKPGVYHYTVKEELGSIGGMTYSDIIYEIKITVTDNIQIAKLEAVMEITSDGKIESEMIFENEYNPQKASLNFRGKKTLEGKKLEAGMFSFKLTPEESAPMPEDNIAVNDSAGDFCFGNITYDSPGTYRYSITEINDSKKGFVYDDSSYSIIIEVEDIDGILVATATGTDNIVFTNYYEPAPLILEGDTALGGKKELSGRKLAEGEFLFSLWNQDEKIMEAKNQIDGSFSFEGITISQAGNHLFTIKEETGKHGGIIYDTAQYDVKVTAEDIDGKLVATEILYTKNGTIADSAIFRNVYKVNPAVIELHAQKILKGRELQEGEFHFILIDKEGNIISTSMNDKHGNIIFEEFEIEKAGIYEYILYEEVGKDKDIIYDNSKYMVKIEAVDSGSGNLNLTINLINNGKQVNHVQFVNVYKKSKVPDVPATGDDNKTLIYELVALIAVIFLYKVYKNLKK